MTQRFIRNRHLSTRWVDGEAFVISESAIENFSALAALVWKLLARATTQAEICLALRKRFPAVEAARIAADVEALMRQMKDKRLVDSSSAPAARKAGRQRSTRR